MMKSLLLLLFFVLATQGQDKPTIALLSLKNFNHVTEGESQVITDRLRVELFNTNRFEIMERDEMDFILKEQGFQNSGACSESNCMIEIGQILGIEFVIAGSIGRLGSTILLNLRSINVQTGKIEKVISIDLKGSLEEIIQKLKIAANNVSAFAESDDLPEPPKPSPTVWNKPEVPVYYRHVPVTAGRTSENCSSLYIVAPKITEEMLGGSFETDELNDASKRIAYAVASKYKNAKIIYERSRTCYNSQMIIINIKDYYKESSSMGQFKGNITIEASFYNSMYSSTPSNSITLNARGSRHWGDSTPFMNAVEALEKEIRKRYRL